MFTQSQKIQPGLIKKQLVKADYTPTHDAMLECTLARIAAKKQTQITDDELWVVDHNDVFTLGQAGKEEHILARGDTPIIKTDRGGQVTWHGHGQLVVYWLFNIERLGWKVRDLVSHAEQAIEDVVNAYLPDTYIAKARQDAPGVYIYKLDGNANSNSNINAATNAKTIAKTKTDIGEGIMLGKIASLGFKIKQGFSYHGIALNLSCDLTPFSMINPCGYAGMQMVRLSDFVNSEDTHLSDEQVSGDLIANIAKRHAGEIALR